jgi:hypothetical protein
VRLEGLGQLKKSNDLIGIRTRDLPSWSIVPQPTTLMVYLYGLHPVAYHDSWYSGRQHNNANKPVELFI